MDSDTSDKPIKGEQYLYQINTYLDSLDIDNLNSHESKSTLKEIVWILAKEILRKSDPLGLRVNEVTDKIHAQFDSFSILRTAEQVSEWFDKESQGTELDEADKFALALIKTYLKGVNAAKLNSPNDASTAKAILVNQDPKGKFRGIFLSLLAHELLHLTENIVNPEETSNSPFLGWTIAALNEIGIIAAITVLPSSSDRELLALNSINAILAILVSVGYVAHPKERRAFGLQIKLFMSKLLNRQ